MVSDLCRCGNFVAAGERGGSAPEVLIFDLSSGRCITALTKGHKSGIGAIAFSSDGEASCLARGSRYTLSVESLKRELRA